MTATRAERDGTTVACGTIGSMVRIEIGVSSEGDVPSPQVRDLAAQLTATLNVADTGIAIVDASSRLVTFNETFVGLTRKVIGRDPVRGMFLNELVSPTGRPRLFEYWDRMMRRTLEGQELFAEGAVPIGSSVGTFELRSAPLYENDAISGAAVSIRDTTTQKRRARHELVEIVLARTFSDGAPFEIALAKALETLCTACGSPGAVLWFSDGADRPLHPLASWVEHWSSEVGEETARGGRALLSLDADSVRVPIHSGEDVIAIVDFARAEHRREGTIDPAEMMRDVGYALERYVVTLRHDRERAALQDAIERKGREWATTFDAIEAPLLIVDEDGVLHRLNRAAMELTGRPYQAVVGAHIRKLPMEGPWQFVADAVDTVRDSGQGLTAQLEDPSGRHWDVVASPSIEDESMRVVIVMRDVTSVIELRESVRRGEQLAAMGELVAGVAHEVRNPLFGISASLDTLELIVSDDPDAAEMFGALRKWVWRLNGLMVQLLEYGKSWSVDLKPGELPEVIRAAASECELAAREKGIAIHVEIDSQSTMLMDASRLTQVFSNLIMNATAYAKKNIWVDARERRIGRNVVIECRVCDDGPGFAREDLHRVFQPFFTRRRSGTGLGLSIAQRIVEEHGGTLSAANGPNGGAVLSMTLPPVPVRK